MLPSGGVSNGIRFYGWNGMDNNFLDLDVVLSKNIDTELIASILFDAFGLEKDRIAIFTSDQMRGEIERSVNEELLCVIYEVSGDVSLILRISDFNISNENRAAQKRLILTFMKYRVASYFDKDNFDDFYHVDELGNLLIAREVWDDSIDDTSVHYFTTLGPYNGGLGDDFDELLGVKSWDEGYLNLDILLRNRIDNDLIARILSDALDIGKDQIAIFTSQQIADGARLPDNQELLCVVKDVSGGVTTMLSITDRSFSNNKIGQKNLIRSFMNYRVASYFDKHYFDEYYFVDERGDLDIELRVRVDGDHDSSEYTFKPWGTYDGSLGDDFVL